MKWRCSNSGWTAPASASTGTMAAAARVKPGGPTGVQIDDYAEKPIVLQSISRAIK